MADKPRYPQIPSTVWWGVRSVLNKSPKATLDDKFLSIQLGVQPAAAKQYVLELRAAGILDEENRATDLAKKWRLPESYEEAVEELLAAVYPSSLLDLAPIDEGDRKRASSWFMQAGYGQGAASNKAATYFLLGTKQPNDAPPRNPSTRQASDQMVTPKAQSEKRVGFATRTGDRKPNASKAYSQRGEREAEPFPLNVNVQIHISADAGTEQIESIFSAMRRYLNDKQNS